MAWGDRAAEQHEKDQPSSCLRPDGAKAELGPILNRQDFLHRLSREDDEIGLCSALLLEPVDHAGRRTDEHYQARIRSAEARMDQLTLMRSAQILDEAEQRRREVMAKFQASRRTMRTPDRSEYVGEWPETVSEIVLDADERRGD